jgi:predicted flap endonuclease-1-like 5' DNA nuclease
MYWFLGLFDPGWRDFSVRNANTEITLIWVLAAVIGFLLYHFLIARKMKDSGIWQARLESLEKELHDEKNRQHKLKSQLDAAAAKANSYAASAGELDKFKIKLHDLQKELDLSRSQASKYRSDYEQEHARVTSMMVDHGEVEETRNRVRNQEKELVQYKTEIQKLRTDLEQALGEKNRLALSLGESQVNELRSKVQKLENDLHTSRMLVAKYQSETNALEEEKKKVREESQSVAEQSKDADLLRSKISQLESDLQKARQVISEHNNLRSELSAMKAEKEKWQQEAEVQATNAAAAFSLQDKLSEKEAALVSAETELQKLQAALDAAKTEQDRLTASGTAVAGLQTEYDRLKNLYTGMESDHAALKASLSALDAKYKDLLTEKNQLREALAKASIPIRPDNLKKIEGIGPKIEEMLIARNILTFSQLAVTPVAVLEEILEDAGEQYRIHDPATWPEQARLLAEGKIEAFEKLTAELKGGRRVE